MNASPIVSSTCWRSLDRYTRRNSARSNATLTTAATRNAQGNVAKNGHPSPFISVTVM